jgi:hypothetical protein
VRPRPLPTRLPPKSNRASKRSALPTSSGQ